MQITQINPASLYDAVRYGFSHATLQDGGRMLHLAGQVGWDGDYNVAEGDLAAQARQALANLSAVLAEVGATPANLVRIRTYVVDNNLEKLGIVSAEIGAFYGKLTPAPNTFIGVQALALPQFLVEIEATAALD